MQQPREGEVLTRRAALIASLAHRGQVDKIGEPYIGHAHRVADGRRQPGSQPMSMRATGAHGHAARPITGRTT